MPTVNYSYMNSSRQHARRNGIALAFSLILSLFFSASVHAQDGKALFKANCSSCHYASEKKGTGPGLKGVLDRIPGGDWKYKWVKNSAAMAASGDAYAVKIKAEYNNGVMTAFPNLKNEEIDAILAYAHEGEKTPAPVAATDPNAGSKTEEKASGNTTFMVLIVLVLLIALIAILRYTKINLRNAVNEKEGQPEEEAMPFLDSVRHWMANNKRKVALIGLFIFGVLIVKGWYGLQGVGIYATEVKKDKWVGYKPSQPINFSHKIHAGQNGIDCKYCHSTVEKSKNASIPSVNICMNCHKAISETANPGSKEEIAKIYAAAGYDADAGTYSLPEQPVKWNKVHVLPDHVFFSHQQHVKVGKVECETCHGNLKEMTVAEQQRPLTMGWCIDCHRKTNVSMEGNGYYTQLHEKMKEKYKGQTSFTVAQMGGIECSRCHY
jgi:cytochrome c2